MLSFSRNGFKLKRMITRSTLLALTLLSLEASTTAAAQQHREAITVQRLIVDARVTQFDGTPIKGLGTENFDVRINGRRAKVEAVDWIEEAAEEERRERRGRTVVLFFQRDIGAVRNAGHARVLRHSEAILEGLGSEDRVAVVRFDSRLALLQDFTSDHRSLRSAIDRSLLAQVEPRREIESESSFARELRSRDLRRVTEPEEALQVVAEALESIDGAKSLLLFGWGFGRYHEMGVQLDRDYEKARRALDAARVTLFSIDFTDASYHSLEDSMRTAAGETGGSYVKTNEFPVISMKRVMRSLRGRYELTIAVPPLERGEHAVKVRLRGARGRVLSRTTYVLE